jgi:hypothetical protein
MSSATVRVDVACDVWANPAATVTWYKHQADISFPTLQQKVSENVRCLQDKNYFCFSVTNITYVV